MKTTAGNWDRSETNLYFLACVAGDINHAKDKSRHILVAVNEMGSNGLELTKGALDNGNAVLIDSGVFSVTMKHAREAGCSLAQALQLAPEKVAGFHALYERYCQVMDDIGDQAWGYIELDQGGRENKIKTPANWKKKAIGQSRFTIP